MTDSDRLISEYQGKMYRERELKERKELIESKDRAQREVAEGELVGVDEGDTME